MGVHIDDNKFVIRKKLKTSHIFSPKIVDINFEV